MKVVVGDTVHPGTASSSAIGHGSHCSLVHSGSQAQTAPLSSSRRSVVSVSSSSSGCLDLRGRWDARDDQRRWGRTLKACRFQARAVGFNLNLDAKTNFDRKRQGDEKIVSASPPFFRKVVFGDCGAEWTMWVNKTLGSLVSLAKIVISGCFQLERAAVLDCHGPHHALPTTAMVQLLRGLLFWNRFGNHCLLQAAKSFRRVPGRAAEGQRSRGHSRVRATKVHSMRESVGQHCESELIW